jgi:hypothetical protein
MVAQIGWSGYNQLSKSGYEHDKVIMSDTGDPAHVSMPGVHRIAALVKRWILRTHQGSHRQPIGRILNPSTFMKH